MKIDGDYLVLSSGKRVYAFGSVVGLCVDLARRSKTGALRYGSDGDIRARPDMDPAILDRFDPDEYLSVEECVELADYMIGAWQQYRQSICPAEPTG